MVIKEDTTMLLNKCELCHGYHSTWESELDCHVYYIVDNDFKISLNDGSTL